MKTLRILCLIGCIALLLESVFSLINVLTEATVFPATITIPLLAIAVLGMICGLVSSRKPKGK